MKTTILSDLTCLTPDSLDTSESWVSGPFKWIKLWSVQWSRGEKKGSWTFCSRKKMPLITCFHSQDGMHIATNKVEADAVAIAALHIDKETKKVKLVVVKEYRIPLGGYYYGLPSGLIEEGMTVEETIEKELKEETGLDIITIDEISPPVFSSAGLTDESSVIAYVSCTGVPSVAGNEESEDIEVLLLDLDELEKLYEMKGEYAGGRMSAKLWLICRETIEHMNTAEN